jgi:hypothetical protein
MATDLRTDLPAVGDPPAPEAASVRRRSWLRRGRRSLETLFLTLFAGLPAAMGVRGVLADPSDHIPHGDIAILELTVRDVGQHEVLLGPYSRLGWNHPGPMEAYLLAGPYRLLDGTHDSLAVGALLVAGISSIAAVLLVRRHAGFLAAVWALLVLTVSVRLLGADFLADSWNPHLPVLPLLAGVLLCWAATQGDAWALPVAVVPMSLALQSHIGYLAPVGAVAAVLGAGLLARGLRRWRQRRRGDEGRVRPLGRWLLAAGAAAEIALLLWLPPIVQQISGNPGNVSLLADYFREGSSEPTLGVSAALRVVADEFAKFPVYVTGGDQHAGALVPGLWPPWAIAVGLVLFGAALVVAALRRRWNVLWLGAFTLAVAVAAVAAASRVEGLPLYYITRWTVVVGILAWITVGLSLLPELVVGLHRSVERVRPGLRADTVLAVPLAVLAVLAMTAVLVTGVGVSRTETPRTDVSGEIGRLEAAVIADLDRLGLRGTPAPPVVRVDFAPTTRPLIVGLPTVEPGAGVVLELARDGVDVQILDIWDQVFGRRYTDRAGDARYVVTIALADGTSPPPQPWQRVLAVDSEFQVYGGVLPTGEPS